MRASWIRKPLGVVLGGAFVVAFSSTATADPDKGGDKTGDRAVCADSYRNAQMQRRNGALRRARESLLLCVSDRCPAVIQPDCLRWLTEVEAAMPTVTFAAKGTDGKDVTDVRVTLDGQPLRDTLDGKSVSVDPGTHTLRFEHGEDPPIDQSIMVREGEKSRVISASWAKAPVDEPGARGAGPAQPASHTGAWIFGGIGAASLATFGVLAVHGMSRRSSLEKECFGHCEQSRIDSVKTELAIADVALGLGIVSVGIARFSSSRGGSSEKSPPPVSVGVAPQKNGASLGFSARF